MVAQQWLRSTACIQSDDSGIRAKAKELSEGASDLESYARKVIAFTSANRGTGAKFDSLDAKKALVAGGSCTSRANLAAALFRANGIAARTISHLPAWSPSLFEHWLVEYWHPDYGWVAVEPTLGKFQPAANELVNLAVSSPEDEDRAFDALQTRYVMPGAPYLSVLELSKELDDVAHAPDNKGRNFAATVGTVKGTPAEMRSLFEQARKNFDSLTAQSKQFSAPSAAAIKNASKLGKASDITAALTR